MPVKIEPITLSAVWSAMRSITEEVGLAIRRSAYSTIVREVDDFSVAVFDGQGREMAQGEYTPGQLGPMPFLVKRFLQDFPRETWQPGDCVVTNDPLIGAGHKPDIFMVVPVFWHDEIVGFIGAVCHHLDIGGPQPGSMAIEGVIDLVAEGIHIMPIKLWEHGELREDVFNLICANVREPVKTGGDLKAQRNAQEHVGRIRMIELFERYGKETMEACFDEIIAQTEAAFRAEISKIPDGKYSAEHYLDGYGPGTPPIKCKLTITVKGSDMLFDFTGSSEQVPAGINSYPNYTRAYCWYAMKSALHPHLPWNEGATRPITATAPEGSFFNPRYGAPCGGRAILASLPFETIMLALAKAIPDKVMAGYGGLQLPGAGGVDPQSGHPFTVAEMTIGSHGALCDRDGLDLLGGPWNAKNTPVEVSENTYPLRIERVYVVPDSGGPGKFRGGVSMVRDTKYLAERTYVSLQSDKFKFAPFGLFDAKHGLVSAAIRRKEDGSEEALDGKGHYVFEYGDVLSILTAGGGGFGDPYEREPELVLHDVMERNVSLEGARRDYGVVIDPKTMVVNYEETKKLRATRNQEQKSSS